MIKRKKCVYGLVRVKKIPPHVHPGDDCFRSEKKKKKERKKKKEEKTKTRKKRKNRNRKMEKNGASYT